MTKILISILLVGWFFLIIYQINKIPDNNSSPTSNIKIEIHNKICNNIVFNDGMEE